MRSGRIIVLIVAGVFAAGVGFYVHRATLTDPISDEAVKRLVQLSLADPQGKPRSLDQWRGKILVVNFWATWCEPCREEVPALVAIQSRFASNGVQIVGIAVDSADKVREFERQYKINYPLMIGGAEVIELARMLGNRAAALPFTLVLDRVGKVVKTRLGGMSEDDLERVVTSISG